VRRKGHEYLSMNYNLVPLFPMVDHVFRFHEPENSYFKVRIPPFLQFGQTQLECKCGKPNAYVEIDSETSELVV